MDLMRRSRRPRLSDEQAERLLSGDDALVERAEPLGALTSELREAGRTPPSDAVAERHLAAISVEVRDTRDRDAAPAPAPRPVRRAGAAVSRGLLVPRRLTAAAAAFTAVVVLAIAGALPGPVQAAAADLLAVVGIAVPDGRSTSQDDAPRVERRERSLPKSSQAPAATGAPRQGTRTDRRDRPRRTRSAGADARDRRSSDRPTASAPADRRADDLRDDRVGGSDNDARRDDDETEALDDDERASGPETDADTDDPSAEDADDPEDAGPIHDGDTEDSLEGDRADTPEPRSTDESPREGD